MPIALGTAESSSNFFSNQRDTYVSRNVFTVGEVVSLEKYSVYNFSHLEECKTAFYLFIIIQSETPKHLRFSSRTSELEFRCIPSTLYAPFSMHPFESLTDLETYTISNTGNEAALLVLMMVPLTSQALSDILGAVFIQLVQNFLVLYSTPTYGTLSFADGVLTASENIKIIFNEPKEITRLQVHCSRYNDVNLLGMTGTPIKRHTNAVHSDGHIVVDFIKTGVGMYMYTVQIHKTAKTAKVLHRISSDLSAQVLLMDEDGHRAIHATVLHVYTDTANSEIENYLVDNGIIHFTASSPDLVLSISIQTDTSLSLIHIPLSIGIIKMKGTVFEYIDMLHKDTNETYRLQIKDAPNLEVFKMGEGGDPEPTPPSKLKIGDVVISEGDDGDLLVNGDGIVNSTILKNPLETETALQMARTRIVFTERNRVRIDRKLKGQWVQGDYVYKNNLVELPLRLGFKDEVYADVKEGDFELNGVAAITVL